MRLLLLSNGMAPGLGYLEHVLPTLRQVLAGARRVAFVPYAQHLLDQHTDIVGAAMADLRVELVGVHRGGRPRAVVESADAVFVGGGNAFRLLAALYEHDLLDAIRSMVGDGAPYVGTSAGTNVACPSIRTTNDMPIVQPPTFQALGLVPFQINPHYPADEPSWAATWGRRGTDGLRSSSRTTTTPSWAWSRARGCRWTAIGQPSRASPVAGFFGAPAGPTCR